VKKRKEGKKITRRESRFVVLNRNDLWRGVPFILCWKIPLLGKIVTVVVVTFFPYLLPSTFKFLKPEVSIRQRLEQTDLYKKRILNRLSVEYHLSETESPKYPITIEDVVVICNKFKDDLVLDKLSNSQLAALCQAVNLNGWGWNGLLKSRLQKYFNILAEDDKMIETEGIVSLTSDELEEANDERGLRLTLSQSEMQSQLSEWLNLRNQHPQLILPLLIYHHAYHKKHLMQDYPPLWLSSPTITSTTIISSS